MRDGGEKGTGRTLTADQQVWRDINQHLWISEQVMMGGEIILMWSALSLERDADRSRDLLWVISRGGFIPEDVSARDDLVWARTAEGYFRFGVRGETITRWLCQDYYPKAARMLETALNGGRWRDV